MNATSTVPAARPAFSERVLAWFRRDPHLWLALLLAVPAMLPLFAPGYFMKAHDARHSIFFLVEFDRSFSAGALWPVWGPDHAIGFGYPTFLLYAPLAFYVGEAFHLLGLGFAAATKMTWAVGFLLGAAGSYRLARRWFTPAVALVASLAFTYAPYHFSQIYVRAALAEFMALAWLPWTVLAFLRLWDEPGPRRAVLAGLALAALMLFHTVSTLTFVPLIGGLLLFLFARDLVRGRRAGRSIWQSVRSTSAGWTLTALVTAGLLSCIFFVPMLLERGGVAQWQWVKESYSYRLHFVYPGQFLLPGWDYGYSVAGPNDGMSFQVGIPIFLLAVLGSVAGVVVRQRRTGRGADRRFMAIFLIAVTLVTLFLMTPAAQVIWDVLPLVELIQFPWRLLAVVVFTLAMLAGFGAWALNRAAPGRGPQAANPFAYVIGLVLIVSSLPFAQPQIVPLRAQDESPLAVLDFEMAFPDMRGMTAWAERPPADADSPLIAQYLAGQPLQKAAIAAGSGEIVGQSSGALAARALVRAEGPVTLRFYTYYFPGWRATVDGRPVAIRADGPNGLIGVDVPAGQHEVEVTFGLTPARIAGRVLAALGVLLCVLLLAWRVLAGPSTAGGPRESDKCRIRGRANLLLFVRVIIIGSPMSQPDMPRPSYGQQRTCSQCGTRVAQKAQTCFFCGAILDSAPHRRLRLPWADLVLFAAIAGVLAVWWLRAPDAPDTRSIASVEAVLSVQRPAATPTAAIVAALQLDDPTPTPQPTRTPTPTPQPTETPVAASPTAAGPTRHKVAAGDSVAAIAAKYGSTIKDIISANSLSADGRLSIGQELLIPIAGPSGGPGPTATPDSTGLMYNVQSGDTISGIATRYKSQVDWILKANNIKPGDVLRIGQPLLVPLVPATPTPIPTAPITPLPATPTEIPGLSAPQLLAPADGATIAGEDSVLLSWTSVGVLAPEEYYVVTLRSPEKETAIATWWLKNTSWRLPAEYRPTGSAGVDYIWRVQVRRGGQDRPGEATSPSSATRRFTWR